MSTEPSQPVSDPSALTIDALRREVSGLEALISQRIDTVLALMGETDKRIQQQFDLIAEGREANFKALKEDIEERVEARDALDAVKFSGIHDKLARLDDRRDDHQEDHERERTVAKETAQRLEREVETTATRLEKGVEETASRLQTGVRTALTAVSETAAVHSEAHNREHVSHERIHGVEKIQVDKAEEAMNKRLAGMNEFRDALSDLAARGVSRELFESHIKEIDTKIDLRASSNSDRITALEQRAASESGRSEGLSLTGRVVLGVAGFVATAVTIVTAILAFNQ